MNMKRIIEKLTPWMIGQSLLPYTAEELAEKRLHRDVSNRMAALCLGISAVDVTMRRRGLYA